MTVEGVDYAWDRPTVAGLVAAGKRFVVRYGGPGSDGKQIWADELRALLAAGIAVVANAEGTANGFRGRTAGIAWAKDADAHFRALGMPAGRPIYFSADWDVQAGEMDDVDAALRGAAEVVGTARVGLYGGYDVIRHCQSAGTARWFWQTYAWSGGRWASGVHLQQYRNHVSLAGGTVDLCQAMVADYGQWGQPLREDDDMDQATFDQRLLGALSGKGEDAKGVQAIIRALPWQYPVTPTTSALNALFAQQLPQLAAGVKALGELVARESSSPDEVRALLAGLPQPSPPVDVDEFAGSVAERVLAGLPTSDGPVSVDVLKAALRDVLGSLNDAPRG